MILPTPAQLSVINSSYVAGTTLKVVAGPGSGKTLTLMLKIKALISQGIVKPEEILVLSLTNKAVDNVVNKLHEVFSENEALGEGQNVDHELVSRIDVMTIHGLANRVVVENQGLINIIEENGWRGLIKLVPPQILKKYIPKGYNLTPKQFERLFREYQIHGRRKHQDVAMEHILNIMKGSKVVTNDEMVILATRYLAMARSDAPESSFSTSTRDLLRQHKIVLVDEFQDLFPALLPFLESISQGKQLILFGDPHQSIYGFLGDNKSLMRSLENARSSHKQDTYFLYDNFRCTPEISTLSSNVVKNGNSENAHDVYFSKPPMGLKPQSVKMTDTNAEMEFIISEICRLVTSSVKFSDIAILTRTNSQLNTVADYLTSYGIPLEKLTSQPDWMSDARIKFLVDLLKVCILVNKEETSNITKTQPGNYQSDFSVIVTMSSSDGLNNKTIQTLFNKAKFADLSLWAVLSQIDDWPISSGNKKKIKVYVKGLQSLMDYLKANPDSSPLALIMKLTEVASMLELSGGNKKVPGTAENFKRHLTEMLVVLKGCRATKPENISLAEWFLETHFEQSTSFNLLTQGLRSDLGRVSISTIHSSKGLEFPAVFLLGGSNSNFPIEKNALYVAITRARNILYLSDIKSLTSSGRDDSAPFLQPGTWKYYNSDLKRPYRPSTSINHSNFKFLLAKYGISPHIRTFSTSALKVTYALKYISR
ncbi:LADA_0B09208g1_1 [Lachancea dasiensis]|uniref:DNA 3'-5' helicase n=1 Tax=Lachancea dasiensis TaxID=1072105 RepID=A0A1G4IUU7_9SACH|nr:LADA_0B09208g1_1 [Lachancea dasiensis]